MSNEKSDICDTSTPENAPSGGASTDDALGHAIDL